MVKGRPSKRIGTRHERAVSIGFTLKSFVNGLVSATVTGVTNPCVSQLVDIVGAAILYVNEMFFFATFSKPVNADCSADCTLSHCRMISMQPGRGICITSVNRWTCGHHFCSCISLEAMPAIEFVVTSRVFSYVVIFSFCICQIFVVLTYVN